MEGRSSRPRRRNLRTVIGTSSCSGVSVTGQAHDKLGAMAEKESGAMSEQESVLAKIVELGAADAQLDVMWLYGSRAKGTYTATSDYDLAVAFRDPVESPLERRLRPETLAQQWADSLGMPDDMLSIVDINQAPLPLAMAVIRTGRAIWVRCPLRLAREENRITSMWELDYLYHQRHYGVS